MKDVTLKRLIGEFEFRWAKLALYLVLSLYAGWASTPNFRLDLWTALWLLLPLIPLFAIVVAGCAKRYIRHD